ncbi:transcriptional regulator with XRE-family HTH domain [Phyllobacterium ifriqiyense]|uniref:Transcriptional regulator with XRE-family HTH domain n=1 Tax=Phyllobacterium ifriqiyense TaxID=314238 RepID=A0ABU0SBH8_9HYPH|nr:helix-turn-helix transcriptional regulator [Phyllobacterium ifriqiyense]MDQ0998098.1 transcriptional regulator with XRE-family HTH domain [Phyllobacterium ifriqiyense]
MMKSLHSDGYTELVLLLKGIRLDNRLTQKFVAERLGKPQSYIAKVEGSERRIDIAEFIAYTRALGVDPIEAFKEYVKRVK